MPAPNSPAAHTHEILIQTLQPAGLIVGARRSVIEPRPVAILAYLVQSSPQGISRDELASVFWPRVPRTKARHSVSQAIHMIRRSEPALNLTIDGDRLRLGIDVRWDVQNVHALIAAGDLASAAERVSAPFLSDVVIPGSNEFEDWKSEVNRKLALHFEEKLSPFLDECFFRDEWRAPRKVLHVVRSVFGLEPEDFNVSGRSRSLVETFSRPQFGPTTGDFAPLIGRTAQIAKLKQAWKEANQGTVTLVGIVGEAGIGKTRLSQAFIRAVTDDAVIVRVRCYENSQNQGFGSIGQALAEPRLLKRLASVEEPWRGTIASLISDRVATNNPSTDTQEFFFEAVARFFQHISEAKPLLLLVDDAQWADAATIDCLTYLTRGHRDNRVMLVLAARTDANRGVTANIRRLFDSPKAVLIPLARLTLDEIRPFASSVSHSSDGASAIAQEIIGLTNGHTFLISELIRRVETSHEGGWSVKNIRLAATSSVLSHASDMMVSLPTESQRLIAILSVLGKPMPYDLVGRASGLNQRRFLRAYEDLLSIGAIQDRAGQLACRHDLIREIIYRALTTTQRRLLHRRAARAIERYHHRSEDLVAHYLAARMRKSLYLAALKAARSNYHNSSPDETDHFLRVAASAAPSPKKRIALLWRRANYAHDSGRLHRAIPLYDQLFTDRILPPARLCFIEARLLDAHCLIGDLDSAQINHWGIQLANRTFSPETIDVHVQCLRSLVRYNFLRSDFEQAAAAVGRMSVVAEQFPGTQGAARALAWKAIIRLAEGDGDGANNLAIEASLQASRYEDPRLACDVVTVRIMTKAYIGDMKEALRACHEGVQLAERYRLFRFRNMCLANMSAVAMDMGLIELAEKNLLEVVSAAESNEVPADIAHGYFNLAVLRYTQKKFEEVSSLCTKCLDVASLAGNHFIITSANALLGLTALERGSLQEARYRRDLILNDTRPYIGDDIVPIEHFLARMSEIENQARSGAARLEQIISAPPPFANACCLMELQLELARLLLKTQRERAERIAVSVLDRAKRCGATVITEAAEHLLLRLQSKLN